MKYLPRIVIEELEDIKLEHTISQDHEAFSKLVEYSQVGRETERLFTLNLRHKPKKYKKKRSRGFII